MTTACKAPAARCDGNRSTMHNTLGRQRPLVRRIRQSIWRGVPGKNFTFKFLCILIPGLIMTGSHQDPDPIDLDPIAVIPAPVVIQSAPGRFRLGPATTVQAADAVFGTVVAREVGRLRASTGLELPVVPSGPADVVILSDLSLPPEGYRLVVEPEVVQVQAADAAGLFYAFQTIRQLLPPEIESAHAAPGVDWSLPAVEILDYPRFPYRGMHLDVGRHFFDVDFVKRYIALMARYKFNRFHWHLTEDQGWRIAINAYPRLTEVGGWRPETVVGNHFDPYVGDGVPHGGFYTQEEIREVVDYAAAHFVTVVPEIEMPGHSTAALAAYPEYGCRPGPYRVSTTWGVMQDVYCPSEATFVFLEAVLTEVMSLFPGEYIHIGGDEVRKEQWQESPLAQNVMVREGLADEEELQSWFVRRIETFLNAHGRRLIGWDEILEGGLTPNATVMAWRGMAGGIEAAKQEHDVIMTPRDYVYFNYYQGDTITEPLAGRPGYRLSLDMVYLFEPIPTELTAHEAGHVLGAQGNVWTEYIKTPEHVEYMAYPRAAALSEVVWSPQAQRNLPGFYKRLKADLEHLDVLGVNYRTPDALNEGPHPAAEHYQAVSSTRPVARSNFDLYLDGNTLTYLKQACRPKDIRGRFSLHVFPTHSDDLAADRKAYGFNTLNFDFVRYGVQFDGKCLIRRQLPEYDMNRLRVGQWIPGQRSIWQVEIPLPPR